MESGRRWWSTLQTRFRSAPKPLCSASAAGVCITSPNRHHRRKWRSSTISTRCIPPHPFYGSRKLTVLLEPTFGPINRKLVQRYMREMGIAGIAPGPNLSKRLTEHRVYPYLLRDLTALLRAPVDRAKLEEQLRRVGQLYADEVISEAEYVKRRDALKAAEAIPKPAFDVIEAIERLKEFSTFVENASADGLREMLRAMFSHVWVEERTIKAVTPKGGYLPLLASLWSILCLSKRGCPMGLSHANDVQWWERYGAVLRAEG
jgi:hypothetical protein